MKIEKNILIRPICLSSRFLKVPIVSASTTSFGKPFHIPDKNHVGRFDRRALSVCRPSSRRLTREYSCSDSNAGFRLDHSTSHIFLKLLLASNFVYVSWQLQCTCTLQHASSLIYWLVYVSLRTRLFHFFASNFQWPVTNVSHSSILSCLKRQWHWFSFVRTKANFVT